MKPAGHAVRVEFLLRTPMVVPATALHFDALVSWAAMVQADQRGLDGISLRHNTGLAKHVHKGQECPMASLVEFDFATAENNMHYIKSIRMADLTNATAEGLFARAPTYDSQRGAGKAGMFNAQTRWVKRAVAFAVVEDMDVFTQLLPRITHIGKLRHWDFGAVANVQCVDDESARARWTQRALPVGSQFAGNHAVSVGALQSPYCRKSLHTEVMMPL